MKFQRSSQENHQIDISPLIDMVFILLIFFMVSTTFVKDMKLDLERPSASSSQPASSKSIRVYIDRHQEIHLDGQSVRSWVLQSKLRDLLKNSSDQSVLVVTDQTVPSQRLIEVVDECRLAGANNVGVVTKGET